MKLAKISTLLAAAAALLALGAPRASAQGKTNASTAVVVSTTMAAAIAEQSPCKSEVAQYCKGKTTYPACLKGHESNLSDSCKKAMSLERKSLLEACADDKAKFCSGVKNGPDLLGCLRQNSADLSPACSKYVAAHSHSKASPSPASGSHP